MQYPMTYCGRCKGLILQANVNYMYSGPTCNCEKPCGGAERRISAERYCIISEQQLKDYLQLIKGTSNG